MTDDTLEFRCKREFATDIFEMNVIDSIAPLPEANSLIDDRRK